VLPPFRKSLASIDTTHHPIDSQTHSLLSSLAEMASLKDINKEILGLRCEFVGLLLEHGVAGETVALTQGLRKKAEEFRKGGGEIYHKA
jgi:hypothetical protein